MTARSRTSTVVLVLALASAVVSAYMAGRASMPTADELALPAPQPTAPLRVTPLQKMGQELLACRMKLAAVTCVNAGPACIQATAAVHGDDIFEAIGGRTAEDEFDVVARVDDQLARCKASVGEVYQRKVTMAGEGK